MSSVTFAPQSSGFRSRQEYFCAYQRSRSNWDSSSGRRAAIRRTRSATAGLARIPASGRFPAIFRRSHRRSRHAAEAVRPEVGHVRRQPYKTVRVLHIRLEDNFLYLSFAASTYASAENIAFGTKICRHAPITVCEPAGGSSSIAISSRLSSEINSLPMLGGRLHLVRHLNAVEDTADFHMLTMALSASSKLIPRRHPTMSGL